tara:strand:+ start:582 stop:707 length:126 start_codon:yes stop_codon:yes gene_type:complete
MNMINKWFNQLKNLFIKPTIKTPTRKTNVKANKKPSRKNDK